VGPAWLIDFTGYTDKPIAHALKLLKSYGQVEQVSRYEWALVDNPSMLPLLANLGIQDCEPEDAAGANAPSEPTPDTGPGKASTQGFSPSRNLSESEKISPRRNFSGLEQASPTRKVSDSEPLRHSSSSRFLDLESRSKNLLLASFWCKTSTVAH
jgi:hypothetical protein